MTALQSARLLSNASNGAPTFVLQGPNPVAGVTTMYMELDLTASTWFKVSGSGPLATFERPIGVFSGFCLPRTIVELVYSAAGAHYAVFARSWLCAINPNYFHIARATFGRSWSNVFVF